MLLLFSVYSYNKLTQKQNIHTDRLFCLTCLLLWSYSKLGGVPQNKTSGDIEGCIWQAKCPSCHPTNKVKAVKGTRSTISNHENHPLNLTLSTHSGWEGHCTVFVPAISLIPVSSNWKAVWCPNINHGYKYQTSRCLEVCFIYSIKLEHEMAHKK